jgi:hypothetical protein
VLYVRAPRLLLLLLLLLPKAGRDAGVPGRGAGGAAGEAAGVCGHRALSQVVLLPGCCSCPAALLTSAGSDSAPGVAGVPANLAQVVLGLTDAGYSGDWSRIGAISTGERGLSIFRTRGGRGDELN